MAEPFLGEICIFGFNFPPRGWATASGQLLSIEQNSAVFCLLGTQFGGDGVRNFALPNLSGRVPLGMGQAAGSPNSYQIGETGDNAGLKADDGTSVTVQNPYLALNFSIALQGIFPSRD